MGQSRNAARFGPLPSRREIPGQILTDNGRLFTGRLARKPATVVFNRMCLANWIRHLLTAPYSPPLPARFERLHKAVRKGLLFERTFATIAQAQADSMPGPRG